MSTPVPKLRRPALTMTCWPMSATLTCAGQPRRLTACKGFCTSRAGRMHQRTSQCVRSSLNLQLLLRQGGDRTGCHAGLCAAVHALLELTPALTAEQAASACTVARGTCRAASWASGSSRGCSSAAGAAAVVRLRWLCCSWYCTFWRAACVCSSTCARCGVSLVGPLCVCTQAAKCEASTAPADAGAVASQAAIERCLRLQLHLRPLQGQP